MFNSKRIFYKVFKWEEFIKIMNNKIYMYIYIYIYIYIHMTMGKNNL